jgi:hypothetical protein
MTSKVNLQVTAKYRKGGPPLAQGESLPRGTRTILLLADDRAGFRAARASLKDRLQAWLCASRLDTDLAQGVPPESAMALALHAERLARPAMCRQLARTIEQIVADGSRPQSLGAPRLLLCRDEVRAARADLEALADRLTAPGPVSAQGVAQVRTLLADGAGPLYHSHSPASLRARAGQALAALNPFPP